MNVIWHLVKNDFRRLRLPLVLFSLLMIGEFIFYSVIAGLFTAPDPAWLNRLQNVPELLLRTLAEPIIAYFLVGWLVFADSPVEKNAHWIARPISGGQLFAAKLTGAGLMFVVWPLVLNLLWWLACGLDWPGVLMAAGQSMAMSSLLVTLGVACAALTDGYPRYILWSIVGLIAFVVLQLIFNFNGGGFSNFSASRLLAAGLFAGLAALTVAGHQFVTRNHRKSLAFAAASVLIVGFISGAWRWNFVRDRPFRLAADDPHYASVTLKLTGPARYRHTKRTPDVQLPLQIVGLPDGVGVAWIKARTDWSFAGQQVWTSTGQTNISELSKETIRRQLGFKTASSTNGPITITLPFSPTLAQRAAREPATFHVSLDLYLAHGKIAAEFPLREAIAPGGVRVYTLSFLSSGPLNETRPGKRTTAENVVSFLLTERSTGGSRPTSVLVNRRTGEFFLSDPVRSGPEAFTALNQVKVTCWRLTFLLGSTPIKLDELSLDVVRFDENELLMRELKVDPVPWTEIASRTH